MLESAADDDYFDGRESASCHQESPTFNVLLFRTAELPVKRLLRSISPAFVWNGLREFKTWWEERPYRVLEAYGFNAALKSDCYSPLPVKEDLLRNKDRWYRPSALKGLKLDLEFMKNLIRELHGRFGTEYDALPPYEQIGAQGFGVGFTRVDARTLYYMFRRIQPRRYFEVGAGTSTRYADFARKQNAAEGTPCAITCVEPSPFEALYSIENIRIVKNEVQNVPFAEFETLEEGDILFIDSSHASRIDSDVNYLVLEVLPRLQKGVYVHIHDIPFPYNFPYPPELYIFPKRFPMYWNEPVLVQAFLAFNDTFRVLLSVSYVEHHDSETIARVFTDRTAEMTYSNVIASLWLQKVKGT